MLAGTRTFAGNCAFLIACLKACGPSLGLELRSRLLFTRMLYFFLHENEQHTYYHRPKYLNVYHKNKVYIV
jgi:hypothetical protein